MQIVFVAGNTIYLFHDDHMMTIWQGSVVQNHEQYGFYAEQDPDGDIQIMNVKRDSLYGELVRQTLIERAINGLD